MSVYGYVSPNSSESERLKMMEMVSVLFIGDAAKKEKDAFLEFLTKYQKEEIMIYNISSMGKTLFINDLKECIKYIISKNINFTIYNKGKANHLSTKEYLLIILDLADFEKSAQSFVSKQALEKAKNDGVELGRPKVSRSLVEEIQFLHTNKGLPYREIAAQTNVSLGTVHKYIKMLQTEE